jgi:histidinol dehydrogenase
MAAAVEDVRPLVSQIRNEGASALVELAKKFDGIDINPIKVTSDELSQALNALDLDLKASLEIAIDRVRRVSELGKPNGFSAELADGAVVQQRYQPIDSVGLYVPGGKAVYPSSVIMNVVPAQVAGVKQLAIATPGQKEFGGRAHPLVLATASLLGVQDVYVIGGPAAVIAFAYGIPEIGLEPVDLVTGPGNLYVAAAKRLLRGVIAIDSEAGPTEVMVIADSTAKAEFVAADLISQAEHDELAAAVLITDSADFAQKVFHEFGLVVQTSVHFGAAQVKRLKAIIAQLGCSRRTIDRGIEQGIHRIEGFGCHRGRRPDGNPGRDGLPFEDVHERGNAGEVFQGIGLHDGDPAQFPARNHRAAHGDGGEHRVQMPACSVRNHGRAALVGNHGQIQIG